MNTIAKYERLSRECDGIMAAIAAERSRPAQVVRVSVLGSGHNALRNRVTTLAFLEDSLRERQRQAERAFAGIAEVERCDSDAFWARFVEARDDAAALARVRRGQ